MNRSQTQSRAHERLTFQDEGVDLDQIVERLAWTPSERLRYLLDMLAFEERAHRAKLLDR